MRLLYHRIIFRVNSFLFGIFSTKAQKHLGAITVEGFKRGMKKQL